MTFVNPSRLAVRTLLPSAMTGLFVFCQVIGVMCATPDLSWAEQDALLPHGGMMCPTGGTTMCPPSTTSSPERQLKPVAAGDLDPATPVVGSNAVLAALSIPACSPRSGADSIVPISISASSVLRI